MLLAYVDESGNTGDVDLGGSTTYSLGCVLVDSGTWPASFDALVSFRRRVREKFDIPMRTEIKANFLLRGSGPIRDLELAPRARKVIYRAHLRVLHELNAKAFAVVIDKRRRLTRAEDIFELAWTTLLQRLERASYYKDAPFMVCHDEGEDIMIRKLVRRARRYLSAGSMYGTGPLVHAAKLLVDDPVPRKSDHSYFIQLADLVAYAAFRDTVAPSAAVAAVCPQGMWRELGAAIRVETNKYRGGTPGIMVREK